jgi:hypothetical protein
MLHRASDSDGEWTWDLELGISGVCIGEVLWKQWEWENGGTEPADDCTFLCGNGNAEHHLGTRALCDMCEPLFGCMYVYVCVCMCACACLYMCIYERMYYVCVCVCGWVGARVYICMHLCMYVCVCVCMYVYMRACMSLYVRLHECVCRPRCICVHTHKCIRMMQFILPVVGLFTVDLWLIFGASIVSCPRTIIVCKPFACSFGFYSLHKSVSIYTCISFTVAFIGGF